MVIKQLIKDIKKAREGFDLKYLSSPFVNLPDKLKLFNGGVLCDMAVGPCACGAWHDEDIMERIELIKEVK